MGTIISGIGVAIGGCIGMVLGIVIGTVIDQRKNNKDDDIK